MKASHYLDSRRDYLFPAIHIEGITCSFCRGAKSSKYHDCYHCGYTLEGSNPDHMGFGMFARANEQSSTNMARYKNFESVDGKNNVKALIIGAIYQSLQRHSLDFDIVTTIPSLSGRKGLHPLFKLTCEVAPIYGVEKKVASVLSVNPGVTKERYIRRGVFQVDRTLVSGKKVLLIDDTWTTGSNMRSAVLSLREAGANVVNAVALARWIRAGNDRGEDKLWMLAEKLRPNFKTYNFFDGE